MVQSERLVIGLTGGMGCGKTTVARLFHDRGATVIDADKEAHAFLQPGTKTYAAILRAFGREILGPDRNINRKKLAGIVFHRAGELKKLNAIVHPALKKKLRALVRHRGRTMVIDAALLQEAGLVQGLDHVVLVHAPLKRRLAWLVKKGFSRREGLARIRSQFPLNKRRKFADHVIVNNGNLQELRRKAGRVWDLIHKVKNHKQS